MCVCAHVRERVHVCVCACWERGVHTPLHLLGSGRWGV